MPNKTTDSFANLAVIQVTESAANTLTFKKLETGISLTEKVAWVINRIEYFISPFTAATFNSAGDALWFGLSVGNSFTAPSLLEQTIIDAQYFLRDDYGAAANALFHELPFVKDFASMPSGGIIVPPVPLYLFAKGETLGGATTVTARMYYTLLELAVDQYWQLVEARRVIGL